MPAFRQHGLDVRSILLHRSFFFFFISCAAVISRIKYCYGSVIVSFGKFTLGAGVTVPEFGSCWVLMWTHRLFNYLRQLSGTGAVPEYTDV